MIGNKVRELREESSILLRQLAAQLDMDTAMLSKMERGDRLFKKEDIIAIAKIFKQDSKALLTLWLADKVVKTIKDDDYKTEALTLAIQLLKED